ncbi:MAG: XdhC family protein [Proteobacteria bacterium]|nr:XdhC family protein [Pseudomonadota bacterium]
MTQIRLAETITERLDRNEAVVVATIVGRQGSTPRPAGAKIVVPAAGNFVGTIGGGLFEARVVERARQVLARGRPAFMSFDLDYAEVGGKEEAPGGRLEVFLDLIEPGEADRMVFSAWHDELVAGRPAFLVTAIQGNDPEPLRVHHALIHASGARTGDLPVPPETVEAVLDEARAAGSTRVRTREETTWIVEPAARAQTAYIVGAGHVSRPTAHVAAMTGFRVVVLDDRPEFAHAARFPDAARVRVVPGYERVLADFPVDEDAFIVIVTRGHLHDKAALAQALKTPAGYIGMIGSRKKRDAIYQALIEEGFTPQDLDRVHSPIGLDIGAETPEEIAISIVSEMVRDRAGRNRG